MAAAALLIKGLIELGLAATDEQVNAFITLLSELKRWNRAYNLTGIKKDEDIVVKHFLDSLLYLKAMPAGQLTVADIGSGAGFPGIPITIIRPETEMYLVEPTKKKSIFLRHIIRQIGLKKTEVIEKRVEEIKVTRELSSHVDIAVSRALFDVKDFVKKTSHILKPGGTLILNKGPKVEAELKNLGDTRCEMLDVSLPLSQIIRHIIVVTPDARI